MHTDEYEISLLRELVVCKKKVEALNKDLVRREVKFKMTTDRFIDLISRGELLVDNQDFVTWLSDYRALRTWQNSMEQYNDILSLMKS